MTGAHGSGRSGERSDGAATRALTRRVSLMLVVFCTLGVGHAALFDSSSGHVAAPVLAVATAGFLLAYALASTRYARLSAGLAIGVQLVLPSLMALATADARIDAMSLAAWSSLALVAASALLGPRAVLAVGVLAVAKALLTAWWVGAGASAVGQAGLYLTASSVAVYVHARHRDVVERARQGVLQAQNIELDRLRHALEQRVEDRTRELASTTAQLGTAYQELKSTQAVLLRNEKMVTMGRLTASIAHELASPLSALLAMLAELDDLREEYTRSIGDPRVGHAEHTALARRVDEALGLARAANEAAVAYVRGIRSHSRDSESEIVEVFDASVVASTATGILASLARGRNVRLMTEVAPAPVLVEGVPSRLSQVVTNLVRNAIDAIADTRREGVVTVRVTCEDDRAVVHVIDDGPGIPPDVLPRIYEPLFTTKPYGEGTGLGLPIVQSIVRDHFRGEIDVTTSPITGTAFIVRLPVAVGAVAHGSRAA